VEDRRRRRITKVINAALTAADISAVVDSHLAQFNDFHASCCLNLLADMHANGGGGKTRKGSIGETATVAALAGHLTSNANAYQPSALAISFNALAKLGFRDDEAAEAVALQVYDRGEEFQNRHLASLVWAFAKLGVHNQMMLSAAGQVVIGRVHTLSPLQMSNLCWGFAKADFELQHLFDDLTPVIVARAGEFWPQHLSTILWSYASLHVEGSQRVFAALGGQLVRGKGRGLTSQGLANVLWAAGTINYSFPDLFAALGPHLRDAADRDALSAQNISNALWAYATLHVRDDEVRSPPSLPQVHAHR
jgi:hypothetical protein